jgi:hypothetical protein
VHFYAWLFFPRIFFFFFTSLICAPISFFSSNIRYQWHQRVVFHYVQSNSFQLNITWCLMSISFFTSIAYFHFYIFREWSSTFRSIFRMLVSNQTSWWLDCDSLFLPKYLMTDIYNTISINAKSNLNLEDSMRWWGIWDMYKIKLPKDIIVSCHFQLSLRHFLRKGFVVSCHLSLSLKYLHTSRQPRFAHQCYSKHLPPFGGDSNVLNITLDTNVLWNNPCKIALWALWGDGPIAHTKVVWASHLGAQHHYTI